MSACAPHWNYYYNKSLKITDTVHEKKIHEVAPYNKTAVHCVGPL